MTVSGEKKVTLDLSSFVYIIVVICTESPIGFSSADVCQRLYICKWESTR